MEGTFCEFFVMFLTSNLFVEAVLFERNQITLKRISKKENKANLCQMYEKDNKIA